MSLSPVQYLIGETLAARSRLGENVWTFPTRIGRRHFDAMEESGLIGWKEGVVQGTLLAWFTEAGKQEFLSHPYTPPIAARFGDEVARRIEDAGCEYASGLSPISTEDDRRRYVAAMAFGRAAQIARGAS